VIALVALGANLASGAVGPRRALEAAVAAMAGAGLVVSARSRWYRSPAFPPGSGPDYVNGAVKLDAPPPPAPLLETLHAIERRLGRTRSRRWEPRVCDLDLIAADALVLPDPATVQRWMALGPDAQRAEAPSSLVLPHPRLQDRGFVLRPLADIAPDWRHPILGATVADMLAALPAAALAGIEPI
jgi:2-amino-4-hydroxy-6-hydroxymethyldihydropteridine diphosphokinase